MDSTPLLKGEEYVRGVEDRLADAEIEVASLKQGQVRTNNQIKCLALGLLTLAGMNIAKKKVSETFGKFQHVITQLEDPGGAQPYYMMFGIAIISRVVSLFFIGPPKPKAEEEELLYVTPRPQEEQEADPPGVMGLVKQLKPFAVFTYQLYLLVMFVYAVYGFVNASVTFGWDQWRRVGNTLEFYETTIFAMLVLFTRSSSLVQTSSEMLAIFQMFTVHSKFVRAHAKFGHAKADVQLYEGDRNTFLEIKKANSGLVSVVLGFSFFVVWPIFLLFAPVVLLPTIILYFWFFLPLMWLSNMFLNKVVLRLLISYSIKRRVEPHSVRLYGVTMSPLRADREEDAKAIQAIQSQSFDTFNYKQNMELFFATGLNYLSWNRYLQIGVMFPVLLDMLSITAVRLFTGEGYIPSLWLTIGERHWYTYFSSVGKSCELALSFVGLYTS